MNPDTDLNTSASLLQRVGQDGGDQAAWDEFVARYGPKIRAWLKTLVHHAWQDFLARRGRAGLGSGDSVVWRNLQTVEARADLEKQLENVFDREVLEEAMARVQRRVAPHTWEAFRLLTFEGLSGAEVAPRVGMQVTMVYVAKSKVQKLLREEIEALEGRGAAP